MGASPTKHALDDIKTKKLFKKITSPKNENFYFSIFDIKTIQIDIKLDQGEREIDLGPKNGFKKIRFSDLEKFQKIFQKVVKNWKFLIKDFKKVLFFPLFFITGGFCNYLVDCLRFTEHQNLN